MTVVHDVKLDEYSDNKFASWQLLDTLVQISNVYSCVQSNSLKMLSDEHLLKRLMFR